MIRIRRGAGALVLLLWWSYGLCDGPITNASDRASVAFLPGPVPGEKVATFPMQPEMRVYINQVEKPAANAKPLLVYYALPNGNTIEQTLGKKTKPGDDWHFNIQHIGAQTRFLRRMLPERDITLACLEAGQKSWPAWRKKYGNDLIPGLLRNVAATAGLTNAEIVLNGHSGGGSLIFGYINASREIPAEVVRIAFLDSNYAYDRQLGHRDKLLNWLRATNHYLCVLAYNDAAGLLDGKPFVSASGGTWGRSHAMWKDMAEELSFVENKAGDLLRLSACDGRLQLLLLENPRRAILHTVQVERNGFIHSMVSGTCSEEKGYTYYGEPAWKEYVSSE